MSKFVFDVYNNLMVSDGKTDYYGIEIENGPVDGIATLFVWFGEHSSYIGMYRHHRQTETI